MFGIPEKFVNQCVDRFGAADQLDILQEECAELIQACSKMKRDLGHITYTDPLANLQEELTHVAISSAVVAKIYNITENHVNDEVNKKRNKYHFDP